MSESRGAMGVPCCSRAARTLPYSCAADPSKGRMLMEERNRVRASRKSPAGAGERESS